MTNVYAYSRDDKIVIGNDYIERIFTASNDRLRTEEIINKRIDGGLSLKLTSFSAEFFIGFKTEGRFRDKIEYLSSNELTLDNINIFKNRVEFIFKPYAFSGARITFVLNYEVTDGSPYMSKYIEMIVDEHFQQNLVIDCIDCEHLCFNECKEPWCIGEVDKAYLSRYHSSLGQPFYLNGMFFASTFPLSDTNISGNMAFVRCFSGKRFDKLKLNCGTTFRTWNTVSGAAKSTDYDTVRREFLRYVRSVSRKIQPRFQYNSWYDHMLNITEDNILNSFTEIEDGLSKALIPPMDSYVVDDGFSDYDGDFWNFNSKFPNGFSKPASLSKKFSSNFGMWIGPRGGYNSKTKTFAKNMEKAGKGGYNRASKDVCVADARYIKNISDYFIEMMNRYDINYWKLDGFLLKACPSKKHGHITGGFNGMYEYTEMWENWIDIFRKMRIHRETNGKDLWINQTSYCNASPFFLQWSDSLWIQNSNDVGFLEKTENGEKLLTADVDRLLSYRDSKYYDFFIKRKYQVPPEYLYNHDPIYGNTAKVSMTDSEYRKYLFMMCARGSFFWELYYSYNMLSPAKWRINADVFRFIKNNADILKNSVFIGSDPSTGGVYGYSAWDENTGIVALRNPSVKAQEFTFTLNKSMGCEAVSGEMKRANIYPYTEKCDSELYSYGDSFTVSLSAGEAILIKFTSVKEKTPSLIYGRFDSENELLLFFDDRIYLSSDMVSSDKEIFSVDLLEDYSTLKISFAENVEKAYVSFTVMNAFGDMTDGEINAVNYSDFVCNENVIPNGRDFTVSLSVGNISDNTCLIKTDDLLLKAYDDGLILSFFGKKAKFKADLSAGDRITLVCEPNSLIKLYKNAELLGSLFCKEYVNSLFGQKLTFSEDAADVKILAKAVKFNETERML